MSTNLNRRTLVAADTAAQEQLEMLLFSKTPIVEMGPVVEFYADALTVDVIGPNFWTTFHRVQRKWERQSWCGFPS
jgi:hypothetical protein